MTERNNKIKFIQTLLHGNVDRHDVRFGTTFIIVKSCSEEPGIYYDENQTALAEAEFQQRIDNAFGLPWVEVRPYNTKTDLLNSYQ